MLRQGGTNPTLKPVYLNWWIGQVNKIVQLPPRLGVVRRRMDSQSLTTSFFLSIFRLLQYQFLLFYYINNTSIAVTGSSFLAPLILAALLL